MLCGDEPAGKCTSTQILVSSISVGKKRARHVTQRARRLYPVYRGSLGEGVVVYIRPSRQVGQLLYCIFEKERCSRERNSRIIIRGQERFCRRFPPLVSVDDFFGGAIKIGNLSGVAIRRVKLPQGVPRLSCPRTHIILRLL